MWVTKLLISPVKKRIFCPKTTKFGPKLAFLVNLGQAMQAYSVPCWWVGWWLWRAGCISQDTYLLYNRKQPSATQNTQQQHMHPLKKRNSPKEDAMDPPLSRFQSRNPTLRSQFQLIEAAHRRKYCANINININILRRKANGGEVENSSLIRTWSSCCHLEGTSHRVSR